MEEHHRVYARFDETLWVGVRWLAQRQELRPEDEYATLSVSTNRELCLTLPDGRTLCDFGPSHEHPGVEGG